MAAVRLCGCHAPYDHASPAGLRAGGPRHHAPAEGTLHWNGVDLRDYTLAALRAAIAWVPQEPFLFSASVAENIALARPDASREQIEHVLASLDGREQRVLRLRFGLDDGHARTLEEVGREFGLTRERIRQIEVQALRKLRHPSRSRKLREFAA